MSPHAIMNSGSGRTAESANSPQPAALKTTKVTTMTNNDWPMGRNIVLEIAHV